MSSLEMWKYKFSIVAKEGVGTFVKIGEVEIPFNSESKFSDILEQIDDLGLEGIEKILTSIEQKITDLVATEALSNKEISERVGCSKRTVETHMRSILTKLKLKKRGEIILQYRSDNFGK